MFCINLTTSKAIAECLLHSLSLSPSSVEAAIAFQPPHRPPILAADDFVFEEEEVANFNICTQPHNKWFVQKTKMKIM